MVTGQVQRPIGQPLGNHNHMRIAYCKVFRNYVQFTPFQSNAALVKNVQKPSTKCFVQVFKVQTGLGLWELAGTLERALCYVAVGL